MRITKDLFFVYEGYGEFAIIGHTDASFQINKDDFRMQYGYVFLLKWWHCKLKEFKVGRNH